MVAFHLGNFPVLHSHLQLEFLGRLLEGTVMQYKKVLINDHLLFSKVS